MNISVTAKPLEKLAGSAVVIPLFEGARQIPREIRRLPQPLVAAVQAVLNSGDFEGKSGQSQVVYATDEVPFHRAMMIGLGEKKKFNATLVREMMGAAVQTAAKLKVADLAIPLLRRAGIDARMFGQAAAEGAGLADFQYADYLTDPEKIRFNVDEITIASPDPVEARRAAVGVKSGRMIAEAVNAARRLVMTPGNALYPEILAKEAVKMAKEAGIKTEVLGPEQIKKLKMGGVWNVGKGSARPPRVIILRYAGNKRKKATDVCLIGKGVTFDTGGISLKPNPRMIEMIGDMMGAATVICATVGAAKLKLPVNVTTIVPAVENMPSGHAYRPGDIITTMSGQTVEIISTDAEGRLILADALTYADRYSPRVMVDVATLTGGVEIALGNQAAALLSNNARLGKQLRRAADKTAERIWELPMYDEYAEQLKSDVADMKNSGGRFGSTIIGGWFLRKFVEKNKWAHLDIAAMDWETKGKPYTPKGATGFGVRLLVQFLTDWK